MLIENENPITLSHAEIVLIKKLAQDEFKTSNPCGDLRLRTKIDDLCSKLDVTSIEEVIRKVLFYNLFELEISEDYVEHINKYSRENADIKRFIRIIMTGIALNSTDIFSDFAFHTHYFDDEEKQEQVKSYVEKINADDETFRMFGTVNSLVNMINLKHDFEKMFNSVFKLDDEEYIQDSETIVDLLNSFSAKYLFIVRNIIENCFPIRIKRELSRDEKELVRFLKYKGDEIDYMGEYDIAPIVFKDKLNSIMSAYCCDNMQDFLITVQIESKLTESSIVWDYTLFRNRAYYLLNLFEKKPNLISEDKQELVNPILNEVKECLEHEIFSVSNEINFCDMISDFTDYDFLNPTKVEPVIKWVQSKPNSMNVISRLVMLLNRFEDIFPLTSFLRGNE